MPLLYLLAGIVAGGCAAGTTLVMGFGVLVAFVAYTGAGMLTVLAGAFLCLLGQSTNWSPPQFRVRHKAAQRVT